jgi:hypothetical protein
MTLYEWLSTAIACVAAAISLVAVIFVGYQVRSAVIQAKQAGRAQQEEWVRQRKRATIEFLTSTMALNRSLKAELPYLDRTAAKAMVLIERANDDLQVEQAIRAYLDYLENVATGVNEGVLDIAVVDRANGGRIVDMAQNYRSYIDRRRIALDDEKLYIELEELAKVIRVRRTQPTWPDC